MILIKLLHYRLHAALVFHPLMGYNSYQHGDDWLRRERLVPDCEPRGAELV
jgi:hypothetical protein